MTTILFRLRAERRGRAALSCSQGEAASAPRGVRPLFMVEFPTSNNIEFPFSSKRIEILLEKLSLQPL